MITHSQIITLMSRRQKTDSVRVGEYCMPSLWLRITILIMSVHPHSKSLRTTIRNLSFPVLFPKPLDYLVLIIKDRCDSLCISAVVALCTIYVRQFALYVCCHSISATNISLVYTYNWSCTMWLWSGVMGRVRVHSRSTPFIIHYYTWNFQLQQTKQRLGCRYICVASCTLCTIIVWTFLNRNVLHVARLVHTQ